MSAYESARSATWAIESVVQKHSDKLPPETVKLIQTLASNVRYDLDRIKKSIYTTSEAVLGNPDDE